MDELLQLKLHQAIAASDSVPDGSTIVLATGDGNIGQFNEEGFLGMCLHIQIVFELMFLTTLLYQGPIRTALRRGWRVELYAWEDGLSEFAVFSFISSKKLYFEKLSWKKNRSCMEARVW